MVKRDKVSFMLSLIFVSLYKNKVLLDKINVLVKSNK